MDRSHNLERSAARFGTVTAFVLRVLYDLVKAIDWAAKSIGCKRVWQNLSLSAL